MRRIILLLFFLCLSSCSKSPQTYTFKDVTKKVSIILNKSADQKNIHSIQIMGKGHIKGTAQIRLMLNEQPYKIEKISGVTSFNWRGDWYSDTAKIEFDPLSVKSGTLKLEYQFED